MGIDRPDDAAVPSDNPGSQRPGVCQVETRHREEYYSALRTQVTQEERAQNRQPATQPDTWPETAAQAIDSPTNAQIEAECARIAEREQQKISPAVRDTESQDPSRHLIGFEHLLKDRDRIKEKIHGMIQESGFSAKEAISRVPDAIRYTFQYDEADYTQSVRADIAV